MIKITKSISAILLSLILMFSSSLIYVNAEDELVVDGKLAYKVGDTITYDLCMQSPEGVMGIQMDLKYDPEYLKLNTESVEAPNFPAATINPDLDDYIVLVWTNIKKLANFKNKATMLKADFEVLKPGKTNITYIIEEMYSNDITYLKEYTISVDYSENGKVVKENDVPIVEDDPGFVDEHQGQFPNYADGKGENNSDVDNNRTIVTSPNKTNEPAANNNGNGNGANNNNNQAVSPQATDASGNIVPTNSAGETLATNEAGNYLNENGETLTTDSSGNYIDKSGNIYQANTTATPSNNADIIPIIIIIAVVLIAIAIVIVIVLKSRKSDEKFDNVNKNNSETNINNDTEEVESPVSADEPSYISENTEDSEKTDE